MIIQFLYVKKFRDFTDQGFCFSNRFHISYNGKTLSIDDKVFYLENFYCDSYKGKSSIQDITAIIGPNGVGKTSILTYIKDVLAFPMSSNEDKLDFLIVLFDKASSEFTVVTNGYQFNKSNLQSKEYKVNITTLKQLKQQYSSKTENINKETVLGIIDEFSKNQIVYLSNVFDGKDEVTYGPISDQMVINLSTNFLVKLNLDDGYTSGYKASETLKSIKYFVEGKNHIPEINIPHEISLNIFTGVNDDLIRKVNSRDYRSSGDNYYLKNIVKSIQEYEKRNPHIDAFNRIKFWMTCNILLQIDGYVDPSQSDKITNNLDKLLNNNIENVIDTLIEVAPDLRRENNKTSQFLNSFAVWDIIFKEYQRLMELIISLIKLCKNVDANFSSFDIPLSKKTMELFQEMIMLEEKTKINHSIISIKWRDMSTGEMMMLRFFANLFVFNLYFKSLPNYKSRPILFLFDELETFYHPQWQKQIVSVLVKFINEYYHDCTVQIIFTSASPLTISDIPKTNVIFLDKIANGISIQSDLNDHKQTFAANIHTLLSDSFFLQNGHIGEFASLKINEVINMLREWKTDDILKNGKYIETIINQIGEPVIKNKLLSMWNERLPFAYNDLNIRLTKLEQNVSNKKGKRSKP